MGGEGGRERQAPAVSAEVRKKQNYGNERVQGVGRGKEGSENVPSCRNSMCTGQKIR